MLKLLVLSIGFIYIIATVTRAFKSPDTIGGFACGCLLVPFAGSILASVIWSLQHPNSPAPGGDFLPPDFLQLQWWLMFAGLIILASIINLTIYFERRRNEAVSYVPPPAPQFRTEVTTIRKLAERLEAHPLVFLITLIASVLGILGFYLQFLRK